RPLGVQERMIETVKAFTALSEEFVELYFRHHPVRATEAGIHDYDHTLPNDSPDGIRDRAVWLRDLEQRLVASVPWRELPVEHRVDYAVMRSRIAALRADLEEIRVYQRNPVIYPQTALDGIFRLLAYPFAPLEDRKESILARMLAVPDYLTAVRPNLQLVPDQWLGLAADLTLSAPGYVDEVGRQLMRSFPGENERIEHAVSRARQGFLQYQQFIDGELERKVGGTFAIGERWMNFKLERELLLDHDCRALESLGRDHIERATRALETEAKVLDPARTWQELVAKGRKRHPEAPRLREAYQAEIELARRFVQEKRLVPLPVGEKLAVIETPVFRRTISPIAAHISQAPFDDDLGGIIEVTPIDSARRKEEQLAQLELHHYSAISAVVANLAYPGQHVQACWAHQAGSRLRRATRSHLLVTGWALYCEDLMLEHGFFLDPHARLFHLRDLLWRACRVVVDVGLQTGRMTFMQAVDFLAENALMPRATALSEVKHYTLVPTQPLGYLVGKLAIQEIRTEVEKRLGTRFDLSDFHHRLLSCGAIPPNLIRQELHDTLV
ncbi:MAG: DUF885 domain-containing protein, partial [Candidatus Eisenbacteria bacterium]